MRYPRVYDLISFLMMLVLQRIFGYIADSKLLVTLRHNKEVCNFCELNRVPDTANLPDSSRNFSPTLRKYLSV